MARKKATINQAEVTIDDYKANVAKNERHFYHLRIEDKQYEMRGNEPVKISEPFIQKYPAENIEETIKNLHDAGFSVETLFDPEKDACIGKTKTHKT